MQSTPEFFYRIENLSLVPGQKTAGFVAILDTVVALRLNQIQPTQHQIEQLQQSVSDQLLNAGILRKTTLTSCAIILFENSAFPRVITTGSLGGSIGIDGSKLHLLKTHLNEGYLGPFVELTPHNVDSPKEALALLSMFHVWAEWAHTLMICDDYMQRKQ